MIGWLSLNLSLHSFCMPHIPVGLVEASVPGNVEIIEKGVLMGWCHGNNGEGVTGALT